MLVFIMCVLLGCYSILVIAIELIILYEYGGLALFIFLAFVLGTLAAAVNRITKKRR